MSDTIDVTPETALVVRQSQSVAPSTLFGTTEPTAVIESASKVAGALKQVIASQGLISKISGKEYPRCEAWTLLGTMLGVFPVLCWTRPVEGGWEARVEARTRDGSVVGAAEAECLRGERNWANRDDFALRSMAQTRATAKCLRMPLGFVMTLAGYEATPAEEMAQEHMEHRPAPAPKPAPRKAPMADAGTRERMIERIGPEAKDSACRYFIDLGAILPTEGLPELPLQYVPVTQAEMKALLLAIQEHETTGVAKEAFPPHKEAFLAPELPAEPEPEAPAEGQTVKGVIEQVNVKEGKSSKGKPWTRFSVRIGAVWYSTFDTKVGEMANLAKETGMEVTLVYKAGEKGNDLLEVRT